MAAGPPRRPRIDPRVGIAFILLCAVVFTCTAPGRIVYPDDEIVFQTTASLWDDGDLAIDGIPKATGEPSGRPPGTFGWAPGRDGKRYGFFSHGLSVVALPLYGLGKGLATAAPESWRHAIRPDVFYFHARSQHADWTRLCVTLTNALVTPLAAWLMVVWLSVLGFSTRVSVATGLCYAFGTLAWPYSRTFLSEPLSALFLVAAAVCIASYHRERTSRPATRWLWAAGAIAGLSIHVHLLNLVALPCYLGYALVPLWRDRQIAAERPAWLGAIALATAGVVLLGLDHYLRFGNPFETGRYDHYSRFISPIGSAIALLISPGRSFLLYSPAILVGLVGWAALRRRVPDAAWFALALILTRLLFVAARSDWWGGWGIGPRYLVPAIPFAVLPLAIVLERVRQLDRWRRVALVAALALCFELQVHLATHSISEWMFHIARAGTVDGVRYIDRSHWWPSHSPVVGFVELRVDMLSAGAVQLARRGHDGLVWVFAILVAGGTLAAFVLERALGRRQ